MEVPKHKMLKDSSRFNHLFPRAVFTEVTVKKNAKVLDTVKFIPQIVEQTKWQVEKFVDHELRGMPFYKACEKLWHFVKDHIAYKKDLDGYEQVRSPRRLFWEKVGDCDCYTVFLYACVKVLDRRAKVIRRITKYSEEYFQHIYPVIIAPDGQHIILDCVTEKFNYEEPYTEKEDHMELTYLDGIPSNSNPDSQFADDTAELGKLFDFLKKNNTSGDNKKTPLKDLIKKGVNAINKVNPATLLLRNGVLAAMKLNFLKVAQRLKYAYLSDAEAQRRGVDMGKFHRLKTIKDKIEKIFYGAGGKPENLKNAILTGKGNANKEVPLSGLDGHYDTSVLEMNISSPLENVLGQDVYYSENMQGLEQIKGFAGLGEVTAASVTAATGVIAAIAGLLKQIGNIFPKKQPGSENFENTANADKEAETIPATNQAELDALTKAAKDSQSNARTGSDTTDTTNPDEEGTFWERNKKWIKPTAWGVGILSLLGISYGIYSSQKKKEEKGTAGFPSEPKRITHKKLKSLPLK